jgi:hypothetical protein
VDVIAEIKNRLRRYPHLRFSETSRSIEVLPPEQSGFPVALFVERNGYTVHFSGWHENFESPRDALNCFSYGLSGDCRLRVTYRGSMAHRWILEEHRNGRWVAESTTGLFFFPFWRRARTVVLQNRIEVAAEQGTAADRATARSS